MIELVLIAILAIAVVALGLQLDQLKKMSRREIINDNLIEIMKVVPSSHRRDIVETYFVYNANYEPFLIESYIRGRDRSRTNQYADTGDGE